MANLDNDTFCPLLFNGVYIDSLGNVNSCCLQDIRASEGTYADLRIQFLSKTLNNPIHKKIKEDSLNGIKNPACKQCWDLESNVNTKDFSGRINAMKYKADWMSSPDAFKLETLDLRWQRTCNYSCIMCNRVYSSKIMQNEIDHAPPNHLIETQHFPFKVTDEIYDVIYKDVNNIKEIYLAGGEPLLMTENVKLLEHFLEHNPNVHIRLNTNLSIIDTEVYKLLKQFPKENIKWTVSVDGCYDMYEYVRAPGIWKQFYNNLKELINTYPNNIDYNILINVLNYDNILELLDILLNNLKQDPNTIKVVNIYGPRDIDVRNLPVTVLTNITEKYKEVLDSVSTENMLGTSLRGIIDILNDKDFTKDIDKSQAFLLKYDKQRNTTYTILGTYLNE